jgi:hypothetical protein
MTGNEPPCWRVRSFLLLSLNVTSWQFFASNQGKDAMSDSRYIAGGMDGWLNVKREPSGVIIALPAFLAVEVTSSRDGRDYFTAQEGIERGNSFSVKAGNLKTGNLSYLPAHLEFSRSRKQLLYPCGRITAITSTENPISLGFHPIQIPDFPHESGLDYLVKSRYAKTWFYLGHGKAVKGRNDRYLHPGTASDGCITVEPSQWTFFYQYLIRCRSGNEKTVGIVFVVR